VLYDLQWFIFLFSVSYAGTLKDGDYNIGGHVIEIRNGVRVSSAKNNSNHKQKETKTQDQKLNFTNRFQNSLYEPASYLSDHLKTLFPESTTTTTTNENTNNNNYNNSNNNRNNNNNNNKCFDNLDTQITKLQSVPNHVNKNIDKQNIARNQTNESLCNDNSFLSDQNILRSSMKGSALRMNDSMTRKVTFSDSVEFNDGDTQPVFTTTAARIPFYQRKAQSKVYDSSEAVSQGRDQSNIAVVTTEQLLDQLRQDALLPKYPLNEDFSYPDSVVISRPSNVAVVSPLGVNHQSTQFRTAEVMQKSTDISSDSLNLGSLNDSIDSVDEFEDNTKSTIITCGNENKIITTTATATPRYKDSVVYSAPIVTNPPTITTPKVIKQDNSVTYIPSKTIGVGKTEQVLLQSNKCAGNTTNDRPLSSQDPIDSSLHRYYNTTADTKTTLPSNVVKIHSDTVKPYLSELLNSDSLEFRNYPSKRKELLPATSHNTCYQNAIVDEPTSSSVVGNQDDDLYRNIEASLASVTFENVSCKQNKQNNEPYMRPTHNESRGEFNNKLVQPELMHAVSTDSEKILNAVHDGTSIPVRVHSGNARRGRVIVSANQKKRRQASNFTPHPPSAAKDSLPQSNRPVPHKKLPPKSTPTAKSKTNIVNRNSVNSGGNHLSKVYSNINSNDKNNKHSPRPKPKPYSVNSPKGPSIPSSPTPKGDSNSYTYTDNTYQVPSPLSSRPDKDTSSYARTPYWYCAG